MGGRVVRAGAALATGAVVATAGLLGGCSSGGDKPAAQTLAQALATAKQKFDTTSGVTFTLSSTGVPQKVNGVTSARGQGVVSATTPKFQGSVGATIKGVTGTVQVIAIGADTWMKFFTPTYTKVDLKTLNAPNPATFFSPSTGVSTMLPATTGLKDAGQVREGKDVLHSYTGTLPGSVVKDLLQLGAASASFDVTYGVDPDGYLRSATLKGPFWKGTTSTYVLSLQDYGQTVDIQAP